MKTKQDLIDMMDADRDYADEHRAEAVLVQDQDHKLADLCLTIAKALDERANYIAGRFDA